MARTAHTDEFPETSRSDLHVPEQETHVTEKVNGPASYFPSIERTYGRPIEEWLDAVRARPSDEKHLTTVAWLKDEHGLGHGHANALVAHVRAERATAD